MRFCSSGDGDRGSPRKALRMAMGVFCRCFDGDTERVLADAVPRGADDDRVTRSDGCD